MNIEKIKILEQLSSSAQKAQADDELYVLKCRTTDSPERAAALAKALRDALPSDAFPQVFAQGNVAVACRPFVDGRPFSASAEDSPLAALEKIAEIAAALGDRIHGDLKPENVFVNADGNCVLTDFRARDFYGVAYETPGSGLAYFAPEQALGQTDEKSDVYALGMMLGKMLCGRTPFDGKSDDAVLAEKNADPDWSTLDHPNVPAEIAELVKKATNADANLRHQSVAEFRTACESAKRVLESGAGARPDEPVPESDGETPSEPAAPLRPNKRFVLVGHRSAGKTVLAAGLYATFSRAKELSVEAADEATKGAANNFKTLIETKQWPAGTTGEAQKLSFRIAHAGNAAELDFDEYMGERVNNVESYIRDILKVPDGVLLLMNPGAPQFKNVLERNKLLSDLKSIIDYLFKLKKRPSVALVVTASDRLENDLKDFRPEFERYVEQIESALDSRDKNWWRRFEISVCGKLDSQDKPKLDPQYIEEPFLWLLERHDARERAARMRGFALRAAGTLCLAALTAAAWWGIDFYRAKAPADALLRVPVSATASAENLQRRVADLARIRAAYCAEKHVAVESAVGDKIVECTETCSPFFLFPDRRRVFAENLHAVEREIDAAKLEWLETKARDALATATKAKCDGIVRDVAEWRPFDADESVEPAMRKRRDALRKLCKEEIPPARERYAFADLSKRLDEAVSTLDSLPRETEEFCAAPACAPKGEHDEMCAKLSERLHAARERVFLNNANSLIALVRKTDVTNIEKTIQTVEEWKKFDDEVPADVAESVVTEKKTALKEALKRKCETGTTERLEKLRAKLMASEAPLPENDATGTELLQWCEKVLSILPQDILGPQKKDLGERLNKIQEEWLGMCEKKIDHFIGGITGRDPKDMLRELKEFCLEHEGNPILPKAEEFVLDKATDALNAMINQENFKNTKDEYIRIKELCAAIRSCGGESEIIRVSYTHRFANLYLDWLENYSRPIRVLGGRIHDLGLSQSNDPYYVTSIVDSYGNVRAGKSPVLKNGWYNYPSTSWGFTLKKPWEHYVLTLNLMDYGTFRDYKRGSRSRIWSNPGTDPAGKSKVEWGDFQLDVQIYGKNLWDLVDEANKEEGNEK